MRSAGIVDEDLVSFYTERLCPEADQVFRLSFALTLSRAAATKLVVRVYQNLVKDLGQYRQNSADELRLALLRLTWDEFQGTQDKTPVDDTKLAQFLSSLSPEARVALVLVDAMGLGQIASATLTEVSVDALATQLGVARRELLRLDATKPTPDALSIYPQLAELLDGELIASVQKTMNEQLTHLGHEDLAARFGGMRGFLQVSLQSYGLTEPELHSLRVLVKSDQVRETQELTGIDQLEKRERFTKIFRRSLITIALFATVFTSVYFLTPPRKVPFKPLETLVYEAEALEEDGEGRLSFPTDVFAQALEYLQSDPELGFSLPTLKLPPAPWAVEGATVIDYEVARIATMQFKRGESDLLSFLFFYEGSLAELPKAAPGNLRGLLYQTYANDQVNIVAWQIEAGVVGLAIGRSAAPELAELAFAVSGMQ